MPRGDSRSHPSPARTKLHRSNGLCLPITDEGARSLDHRPLSFARDSPHGWREATVRRPARSTLQLWQGDRASASGHPEGVELFTFNLYTDQVSLLASKQKRRRYEPRLVLSIVVLLQITQRITAIPATITARHPTNVKSARSLITGSLRIISSTRDAPISSVDICLDFAAQQSAL